MDLKLVTEVNEARRGRRAIAVVTDLKTGAARTVTEEAVASDPDGEVIASAFRVGKSRVIDGEDGERFLTVHVPPPRLVCIGAVHISQALVPMARLLNYDLTIVDPRTAFATPERFPDIRLLAEWPDVALPDVGLDRYTAFCALTHDPKIDDPGLVAAFGAECFYIGALGSRKTHAKRLERLRAAGVCEDDLARIHAPIGLPIGAQSPAEIAVSVMAEITEALRQGGDRPGGRVAA